MNRSGTDRSRTDNAEWYRRAVAAIPGGVNSPVRSFGSVGGTPYFVADANGAYVTDVEGNRYVDYVQSYGASILGHGDPGVAAAVVEALSHGSTYGAPTPGEVLLAEALCERVPGMGQVRLVSSGTEATMSAVRLARGVTGRDVVVKFAGHYHGHSDGLLAEGGSGVADRGLTGSEGVTAGAVADTVVVPWNVVPVLDDRVAALIVEPVAANTGLIAPLEGLLPALRAECDRVGALLIFDEVITGFRVHIGGVTAREGVRPDLWTFGKIIGGGLPMGAFGATREIMEHLAPLGGVYQAGTLSGNPLATAAGLAVLRRLTPDVYETLERTASRLARASARRSPPPGSR
ncbi:MAG: glutamate-1-semialdehyde 2,1-aminomutase [Microthrixaceae bacterium]